MAFNKNKKIVTTALTAAMVASAVAPVAAAKLTPAQDATKAVDGYYKLSVKTKADVSNSAKVKKAALAKVAKLGKKDAKLKASLTAKVAKKSAAINKYYQTVIVAAETEAKAIAAVEAALKLGAETPVTETTTKEQVEALYTQVIALIGKVKNEAKKAEFKTAADKLKADALAKIEALATPKVTGVTAINATQLVVAFNKDVDATTAETTTNYTLNDGNAVSAAEVQEDGKSVLLTVTTAYTTATTVAVNVSGVALKSDTTKSFPLFSAVVKVEDTTKASITSVSSSTNGATATSATINFSEPVKSGIVKIDGVSVATITSTVSSLPVTGLALDSTKTHKVEIVNLTDTANNVNAVATVDFSVKKDADAPVVSSVTALGDYQLLVTFNKKVNAATVATGDVAVKDELLNAVTVSGFAAQAGDTTGTKFVITLDKLATEVADLYKNQASRNLTVVFADKSVDDTLGNQLAANTKAVTLSKDVTAPGVTGITFKKDPTTKEITELKVSFDEAISSLDLTKFTVVDANGVLKTGILTGAVVTISGKDAVINIADVALTGNHSFQIASGAAKDLALTANSSKAFAGTVDFGTTSTVGTFDFIDGDVSLTNGDVSEAGNVITVTFPEAVKGGAVAGSATDVNNYSINGKPLPAGSTITLDGTQKVATITIAEESITTSDAVAVFTINNVVSLSGKTIKPVTTTTAVVDNVAPVLQSARVLDNNSIELTYSEGLAALSAADVGTEFAVYEGTTAKTLVNADVKATRVTGFNNKLVIDLQGAITLDLTKEISVKTLVDASTAVTDAATNAHRADVKVVATK